MVNKSNNVKPTKWYTVKTAARFMVEPRRKIRAWCRDGSFPHATHTDTGTWAIPQNDIDALTKRLRADKIAMVERDLTGAARMRPTTASCRRIRKRVTGDKTLTADQRKTFVSRIDAYEHEWDTKYAKRNKS